MSDESVREYLKQDEPRNKLMLLVNPFTKLSGWPALALGLVIVAGTVALAVFGGVKFDGIADVHVGPGAPVEMWRGSGAEVHAQPPYAGPSLPVWALAAVPVMDWLVVALLFWMAGAIFGGGPRRAVDYFAMSGIGRFPFIVAGALWIQPVLGKYVPALIQLAMNPRPSALAGVPGLWWVVVGGIVTMLIMVWGLFLNFFALRESSGMPIRKAIPVYIGVIIIGEIISKLAILLPLMLPLTLKDMTNPHRYGTP